MGKADQSKQSTWRLRPGERRVLIILGDFILAWVALAIAIYIWAIAQLQNLTLFEFIQARLQAWFLLLPIIWVVLLMILTALLMSSQQ